jgi:hypothetical protein
MTATPKLRWAAVGTVLVLAAVAAYMSYGHLRAVAEGQGEDAAALFPISVDGLIVAASLVLLARRRSGLPGGVLPWAGLLLGVLATIAGNVASAEPTTVARLVAAWPPVAFALSYEYLLTLLRPADREDPAPAPVIVYDLPEQVEQTGLEVAEEPARTDVSDRSDAPGQTGLIQPEQTDPDRSDISSRTDSSDRSADRSGRSQQTGPKRGKQTGPARKQRTDAELSEAAQQMAEQNGTSPTRYQLKQALGIGSERAARVLAELDYVPADDHTSNGVVTPTKDSR